MIKKENQKNQNSNGCKVIKPLDSVWKDALKNLVNSGELSVEEYNKCLENLYDKKRS